MRGNTEDSQAFNQHFKSGKFSQARKVLGGNVSLTPNGSLVNFFDVNGITRTVTMPPLEGGRFYVVANIGVTGLIEVRSALGGLLSTLNPKDSVLLFASDIEWTALRGWADLAVFTNTINGLVPAPQSGVPGSMFLRDDGQWGQVQVTGIVDAFKFITDGTNTAIGSGPDTFRLRSSTGSVGITVTNGQAIYGDNADFDVIEAQVNHNGLLNYSANQHIDHTLVSVTAGVGMSGGGTIAASRTLDFSPHGLTVDAAPLLTDYAVMDLAAGGPRTSLWSSINAIFNHNNLLNYVANQHIDHSGVSIVAGSGLTGGGTIVASRTLSLDITGLGTDTPVLTDTFPFFDVSGADNNKATFSVLNGILDHNSLLNYVAAQHVSHTAVSVSTTEGIQGGGDISATRTHKLDINGLAADAAPDTANDYAVTYDASAGTHKKVLLANMPNPGTFAATTAMIFAQTSAPTGWTKSVTHNDKALRVVSGAASSGGTNSFSTVMAQTTVGNTALTLAQMPAHNHLMAGLYGAEDSTTQDVRITLTGNAARPGGSTSVTETKGSGSTHNHTITMAMQYVDVIIATKD